MSIMISIFPAMIIAQDIIKTTDVNLNLRKYPEIDNNIICVIPKGSVFTVDYAEQSDTTWLTVRFNGNSGYVYAGYVKSPVIHDSYSYKSGTDIRYYTNSKGEKVQSPTYYSRPPTGATAECRDGTFSFSQSRRGTCSHHGGVKRWL